MKTVKTMAFASMFLLTLTAGKCFVISSFDSSDDDDEGLTIVVSNAETTSSEVVQSLSQALAIAEIASQSAQYVNDIYISDPLRYSCDNPNGVVSLSVNDEDASNRISKGDDLFLSYKNCDVNDLIANGDLEISVLDTVGMDMGHFDSGTDWLCTLGANATSFQVITDSGVFIANGDLKIALHFDAKRAILEAKIMTNNLALESEFQRGLSDMEISQFINLAVVPSSYSLTIDLLELSSDALNGKVSVATKLESISGMEWLKLDEYFVDLLTPENGKMHISGNNSTAEVSIMPGEQVSIGIDTNGDSILDTAISTTWVEIH